MRGTGRAAFAATLLLILGTLNVIYGIGALGIVGASLGAVGALLSIAGENPWWSLAVFVLCLYVIHGIFIFGQDVKEIRG